MGNLNIVGGGFTITPEIFGVRAGLPIHKDSGFVEGPWEELPWTSVVRMSILEQEYIQCFIHQCDPTPEAAGVTRLGEQKKIPCRSHVAEPNFQIEIGVGPSRMGSHLGLYKGHRSRRNTVNENRRRATTHGGAGAEVSLPRSLQVHSMMRRLDNRTQ